MNLISKGVLALLISGSMATHANAQLGNYVNDAQKVVQGGGGKPGTSEISDGLKEALKIGAKKATEKISAPNVYEPRCRRRICQGPRHFC